LQKTSSGKFEADWKLLSVLRLNGFVIIIYLNERKAFAKSTIREGPPFRLRGISLAQNR
jgi:hypothetical protein